MKKLLAIVLCLAMCCTCLTACGSKNEPAAQTSTEPEVVTFRMATQSAANESNYVYQAGMRFAEKVDELSGGTMKCEFYAGGQLGSSGELVESCSIGTVDMVIGVAPDMYGNIDPSWLLLCMPFLVTTPEEGKKLLTDGNEMMAALADSLIEKADIRYCGQEYHSMRSIVTIDKVIKGAYDLKGLTMRSPEARPSIAWLSACGASPVTVTWSELFTSLQTGAVDGAENALTEFYSSNMQDILATASVTNHMLVNAVIACNNTFYESLTPEQQKVIDEASADMQDFTWTAHQEFLEEGFKAFEEAGMTVTYADGVDLDSFLEASKDVYKEFVERGDFTEELYLKAYNYTK